MHRECRERFPCHRLQRKPLVSYPGMHHGTCVTHVPWCMSGWLTRNSVGNVSGIPGACATRNFAYMVRGPWTNIREMTTSQKLVYGARQVQWLVVRIFKSLWIWQVFWHNSATVEASTSNMIILTPQIRVFGTLRYLYIIRLIRYWNGVQIS